MKSSAPSSRKRCAVALPRPVPPPVMRMRLPRRRSCWNMGFGPPCGNWRLYPRANNLVGGEEENGGGNFRFGEAQVSAQKTGANLGHSHLRSALPSGHGARPLDLRLRRAYAGWEEIFGRGCCPSQSPRFGAGRRAWRAAPEIRETLREIPPAAFRPANRD